MKKLLSLFLSKQVSGGGVIALLALLSFSFISTGASFPHLPLSPGLLSPSHFQNRNLLPVGNSRFIFDQSGRAVRKSRSEDSIDLAFRIHRAIATSS